MLALPGWAQFLDAVFGSNIQQTASTGASALEFVEHIATDRVTTRDADAMRKAVERAPVGKGLTYIGEKAANSCAGEKITDYLGAGIYYTGEAVGGLKKAFWKGLKGLW